MQAISGYDTGVGLTLGQSNSSFVTTDRLHLSPFPMLILFSGHSDYRTSQIRQKSDH